MKYWDVAGGPGCQAHPDGHTIARGYTNRKIAPNTANETCRSR